MVRKIDYVLKRCADNYGYGLWLQDFTYYKNRPPEEGRQAYGKWLAYQLPCGHKTHAKWRKERIQRLLAGKAPGRADRKPMV
jgi:hypothetical protein